MRKYIIGMLFGFAMAFTLSTQAAEIKSLVGKAIQGEFAVKLEGVALEKKAIVIDGSSYLPVKSIADSLGLDATFDKVTGIELKKKEETATVESPNETVLPSTQSPINLKNLNLHILGVKAQLVASTTIFSQIKSDHPDYEKTKNQVEQVQLELDALEKQKADLTN